MRIGFDAKRLYNNFTGLGNYSRTLLDNLIAYYPDEEYYLYTPKIQHTLETDVYFYNERIKTTLNEGVMGAYWRTFSIKKDLISDGIDIYHGLSHELPVGIANTKIKSIVTIHDIIYKTYPQMFTAIDRAIYDTKFRYSCKCADKIVAISESTKRDIINEFGVSEDRIEVIYQAINPIFYNMQSEEEVATRLKQYDLPQDFLLYVGTINKRKNLLNIVKAYSLLPKSLQIPLVVIGDGREYKNEVLQYIDSNGLVDRVLMFGGVQDTKTLQSFYQAATLFLFPSIYEGFGLPVTEALLCKTPVLTSKTSSLPEAGGPGAVYVDPLSIDEITLEMENVLTNSKLMKQLSEDGYRFAHEQFDPEKITAQMYKLYNTILM